MRSTKYVICESFTSIGPFMVLDEVAEVDDVDGAAVLVLDF